MQNRIVDIVLGIVIAAAGVLLMVVGALQFSDISGMEAAGQVHGLSSKVKFVYTYLGKWGVLGAYVLFGVCVLCSGGSRLLTAFNGAPKRDTAV